MNTQIDMQLGDQLPHISSPLACPVGLLPSLINLMPPSSFGVAVSALKIAGFFDAINRDLCWFDQFFLTAVRCWMNHLLFLLFFSAQLGNYTIFFDYTKPIYCTI